MSLYDLPNEMLIKLITTMYEVRFDHLTDEKIVMLKHDVDQEIEKRNNNKKFKRFSSLISEKDENIFKNIKDIDINERSLRITIIFKTNDFYSYDLLNRCWEINFNYFTRFEDLSPSDIPYAIFLKEKTLDYFPMYKFNEI
jgi:hypothetical protein